MSKHVSGVLAAVILTLALAALAVAQTTTTTTTTQKKVVQNPDGTFTVIEYPVKKEIKLDLTPVTIQGATGIATVLRDDDGTKIKLNLASIPAEVSALTLYAIDDTGAVTALGPITIANGAGELVTTTPLTKFMLVASPEGALTTYDANTKIFFRSAVPQGLAVIPVHSNPAGEKVAAVAAPAAVVAPTATAAATYTAPMLNIPAYKKGDDTKIKVDFTGALTGARANVFITPKKDGPTEVKMRFHDLKAAPSGQHFIVWAVGADGAYQKIGEVLNTGGKNEAEIKAETTLADFGLLITQEGTIGVSPIGPAVATIMIVP